MRKGQISFDFIFAIIVVLLFIGSMQVITGQIQETQAEAAIRSQERAIALNVAGVLNGLYSVSEPEADVTITYVSPQILVPHENLLQSCDITVQYDSEASAYTAVTVSYPAGTTDIQESVSINYYDDGVPSSIETHCGEELTLAG